MYLSTSFQWHGANRFLGTKKSPLQAFEAVSSRSSRLITASPIAILRTRPWRWLSLSLDLRRDPADRHVLKHVDALIDHGMLTSEPKLCRHVNQAITRTARIRHHDPLSQGHQLSGSVLPRERFRSLAHCRSSRARRGCLELGICRTFSVFPSDGEKFVLPCFGGHLKSGTLRVNEFAA